MTATLTPARIIICMGVSSCGKTATGTALAHELGAPFLDGDAFHPAANKEKMRAGTPLTDEDRWPWLANLAQALHAAADKSGTAVGACSALKRAYRDYLRTKAGEPILFVFLKGTEAVIAARIAARQHEYMPASLLPSQFATLEVPGGDENVITVDITEPIDAIVTDVAGTYRSLMPR